MNTIGYFEIQADEPGELVKFYHEIFGWHFIKDENIPIEYYRIEMAGVYGGLLKRPAPIPTPPTGTNAYVCSIQVENFDSVLEKIMKSNGQVAMEKFAVVGKCWQGYFLDPNGNTFGIFQVDESAA